MEENRERLRNWEPGKSHIKITFRKRSSHCFVQLRLLKILDWPQENALQMRLQ